MRTAVLLISALVLSVTMLVGCSAGDAPMGSPEKAMKEYDAMTPEKKIEFIKNSPMPAPEKKKRIEEIQQQAGLPVDSSMITGAPPGAR